MNGTASTWKSDVERWKLDVERWKLNVERVGKRSTLNVQRPTFKRAVAAYWFSVFPLDSFVGNLVGNFVDQTSEKAGIFDKVRDKVSDKGPSFFRVLGQAPISPGWKLAPVEEFLAENKSRRRNRRSPYKWFA